MKLTLLLSFILCSCTPARTETKTPIAGHLVEQGIPTLHLRLEYYRDWDTKYYICNVIEGDFTLPEAARLGVPPEYFIYCLITYLNNQTITIRCVKPLRA